MRIARTFVVLAILALVVLPASARWIEFGTAEPATAPEATIVSSDFSGVTMTMEIPGVEAIDVATELGTFTKLTVPGSYYTIGIGEPMLPVVREYLELPHGATPHLTVLRADYVEVPLADLGLSRRVIPTQESVEKMPGAREAAVFAFDQAAYARAGHTPAVAAALGEIAQARAHRFVELEIFPVQYNPAAGTVRYLTNFELTVEFEGGDMGATMAAMERYAAHDFDAFASKHLLNADVFATRGVPTLPIGYLIVCYDDFYEEIQPLAGLRHRLGYETTVVKTSEIPGGATSTNIKAYIQDAYDNWPVPPTFVLLVGDSGQIPVFIGGASGSAADVYYGSMGGAGDWVPDIYMGRFSCNTEAEVTLLTDKTVKYIRFALSSGTDWVDDATFMASSDNYAVSEGTHNYCISNWVEPDGYTVNKRYSVTYSATTAQVLADINGGISMLTYSGHGSVNSWADGPPVSATQVEALTNVDMLPMVQSYACLTGQFTSQCFGETWTLAPNGGVIFLGASDSSYWDEDDIMESAVYDAWFGNDYTWCRGMFDEGLWAVYQAYSGGGRTQYYYEVYTVFGDPALDPWTAGAPMDLAVTYNGVLPLGQNTFSVDVGTVAGRDPVENAIVCLYMDGEFYATGLTNGTGHVDILIDTPPTDVGSMDVWVSKHDYKPHSGSVDVIVPVTYTINPPTIPIDTATDLVVTVWDSAGVELPDVEITIDGWGIAPVVDVTDALGEAHFNITAPYGEDLTIVGSELGQSYNCFADVISVTGGATFTSADIDASVAAIGLYGTLAPFYEGMITGTCPEGGFDLYAAGCGIDLFGNAGYSTVLDLFGTPTSTGTVNCALAKEGYDIYLEDITVQAVYGQLAGEVYEAPARAPIEGAVIKGYAAGSDTTGATPVFTAISGIGGVYAIEGDLEVSHYDVYVLKFGYVTLFEDVFVMYGVNDQDFYMEFAPSGVVSGTVTEVGTGAPLEAAVRFYRSDDMSLYAETTSDPVTGQYSQTLPYFNYTMNVRAYHHIPVTLGITVDEPTEMFDFQLEETLANLLIINDAVAARQELVKMDKSGNVIDIWNGVEDERSVHEFESDLIDLGYDVTLETAASSDPLTWMNYDFIIHTSGANTSPVLDAAYRTNLESYVAGGGKLLIEGGELVYDAVSYPGYPTFAANVLHANDWEHDSSGTSITVYDAVHPLTTFPNTVGSITVSYSGYGDQDSYIPEPDADIVMSWSNYGTLASVLVYDDTPDPSSGQIVFYSFNYAVAGAAGRKDLLENTVVYLITPESTPTGGISGIATLQGSIDQTGILVTASPGGASAYSNKEGFYSIPELYAGTYTVTATKLDWSTDVETGVVVSEGTVTPGVNFFLTPTTTYEHCDSPALPIPDSNAAGVYDYLTFADEVEITEIEFYLDLTHSYIGDLIVEVTSPDGTTVRLHNRSGGSSDNIVGWYPGDLSVDGPGSLDDFIGENAQGEWELWVSDNAGGDIGTVNTWCVRVTGGAGTGIEDEFDAPVRYELTGVSPNPFNPVTVVTYGTPFAGHVDLAVYNIAGQLVKTLVDGETGAGWHTVTWDGRDDSGRTIASGVYFARMHAEGFTGSTKMVLLK
ncbi:proprotein convertase P-domain-containing protein [bacterium]|nr:proprotein convertase P-domain-containing protein [bacterium]